MCDPREARHDQTGRHTAGASNPRSRPTVTTATPPDIRPSPAVHLSVNHTFGEEIIRSLIDRFKDVQSCWISCSGRFLPNWSPITFRIERR